MADYPASLPPADLEVAGRDHGEAWDEVHAALTELGTDPAGSETTVAARLNALDEAAGAEPVTVVASSGVAETLMLPAGGIKTWDVTLDDDCVLTFAGATAGRMCIITVILRQDATGGRAVTFPAEVIWPNAAAPALSTLADQADVVSFSSPDSGTTWFGAVVGVNFEPPPAPTAPGAPTALDATAGDGEVDLTWTAPANDGGSAITDYVVQYRTSAGPGTWQTFSEGTSAATSATVTGLTNGTGYDFQVAAVNSVGQGAYSATDSATPTAPTAPAQVGTVTPTPGDGQVALAWSAPANGGSPITDYVVQYRTPAGSGTWQTFSEGTSATTGATVTGLTNGTEYGFRVAAVNAVGQGSYSNEVTATPTAGSSPGHGPRYLNMPGGSGNYASTPSAAALNISGTIELIVRARLTDWTPSASHTLLAKWNANNTDRQYILQVQTDGKLLAAWERSSGGFMSATSSVATGLTDGTDKWVRARIVPDNGSGASVVTFYLSDDGSSWTQLGSTVTQGGTASSIQTGTGLALNAGANAAGTSGVITGRLYYAEVRNNNTPVSQMDFSAQTAGATSLTATTGETWTVHGTAAIT